MSAAGAGVEELPGGVLRSRVHARIGLLGNPSDGFGGVCISLSLANHWAEVRRTAAACIAHAARLSLNRRAPLQVTLTPGGLALRLCPPGGDAAAGLADGGCRLMHATLLALEESLEAAGTPLPPGSAFSLAYSTTIPRQRGLSGSSAIAAAALNCLLRHYQLEAAVPVAQRPALLLRAEASMGITAGLQDRVIQTFGGLLLMDFSAPEPRLQRLDPSRLPPLWLIHRPGGEPGADSGAVHSDVKQRWLAGDADVRWVWAAAGRGWYQSSPCMPVWRRPG